MGNEPTSPEPPQRGALLAAVLGVVTIALAAAVQLLDKWESLRWLWATLIVVGVVVAGVAAVLASPWWQHRQAAEAAAERARRSREQDRDRALSELEPRARGVLPFSGRQGSYFTGRERVLREAVAWLTAPPSREPAMLVVTGKAGSGKSAVLGRLVVLSDPARRERALRADLDPDTVPPQDSIDAVVYARGRPVERLVQALAEAASVEATDQQALLVALRARRTAGRPVLVVAVDALDEADGAEDWASLLAQLAAGATELGVRMLVGTREHLVVRLRAHAKVIDLDEPGNLGPGDLAEYVRRCLLLEGDPQVATPYRNRPELAGEVADAVAERAGKTFLVAQLVAQGLVDDDDVVNVAEPGWQDRFPVTVDDAMREYLDRFGPDRSRVRDLLLPLAFAHGYGLADETLWADLATSLGTATYQRQDVGWLLQDTSVPDLLLRTDLQVNGHATAAYRLFHKALDDYLKRKGNNEVRHAPEEVQRRYTEGLRARVRDAGQGWLGADAYTRAHLATHAAAAGQLDELVQDPGFLAVADPSSVLRALPTLRDPAAKRAGRVFRRTAHHLRARAPGERASYLELAARQSRADDVAERIGASFPSRPWRVLWANWRPTQALGVVGRTAKPIHAVALAELDGEVVVVAGGRDGTVRTWDLHGTMISSTTPEAWVWSIATGEADGRPVAACGYDDGWIRVWDLASGAPVIEPIAAHTSYLKAVAFAQVDGRAVVASGGGDGRIRIWDLLERRDIGQTIEAYSGSVEALRIEPLLGHTALVSSGDRGRDGDDDKLIKIWDLRDQSLLCELPTDPESLIRSLACGRWEGRPILISGGVDQNIRVWDLQTRSQLREIRDAGSRWIEAVALVGSDAAPVLLCSGEGSTLNRWNIDGTSAGSALEGHDDRVLSLDVRRMADHYLVVSGSYDKTVRAWTIGEEEPVADADHDAHAGGVSAVAVGQLPGSDLVVSAGDEDSTVRRWRLQDGSAVRLPAELRSWIVQDVAVAEQQGRSPLVAAGGYDNKVHLWDLDTGERLQVCTGHTSMVFAVAFGERHGELVIISAGGDYTIRVWDPTTGEQIGPSLTTGSNKTVFALAVTHWEGQPILVSGDAGNTISIWDLNSGRTIGPELSDHDDTVNAVAVGDLDGRRVIVSASDDRTVRVWDLAGRHQIGASFDGHEDWVQAVGIARTNGRPVIVSGGRDRSLRIWTTSGRPLHAIDVGSAVRGIAVCRDSVVLVATSRGLAAFELAELL
jgi:WD40 repeat protein